MIDRDDRIVEFDSLFMLKALWHRVWIIALAMVIFATATYSATKIFVEPTYTANVVIYADNLTEKPVKEQQSTISGGDLSTASRLVGTYIVILQTHETLKEIIDTSGVSYSTDELSEMISVNNEGSEFFSVDVSSHDSDEAVLIANTVCKVLPERISDIVEGARVRTVQDAYSAKQTGPDAMKMGLIGALIGLLMAAAVIIILEFRDDKIYDEKFISSVSDNAPVLALIPDLRDTRAFSRNYYYGRSYGYTKEVKNEETETDGTEEPLSDLEKDKLIICENLDFTASEAYKVLRTNLTYVMEHKTEGSKVIGVTSADRSEGKTTTSINLSYVFAQTGKRVVTIEGDLRLPTIEARLDIESTNGFTDFVEGSRSSVGTSPSGKLENWKVISAGSRTENPSETLGNKRVGLLMTTLKRDYDIVIVDLPPVNEVTDAMAIAPYLDGMIFVVKARETKKNPFKRALHHLELAGAPLIGFVLTNATGDGGKYDKYYKYDKYDKYGKYDRYGNRYYRKNGYKQPYGE